MSFLDLDERLIEIFSQVDLVYSPLVDNKEFPEMVDVALIEGAVSNEDDLAKIKKVRAHTRTLISLGDCAVTGNVPSMRNSIPVSDIYARAYLENVSYRPMIPQLIIPKLLKRVCPVHEVVEVDLFVPGCPPPADAIYYVLTELLAGRTPDVKTVTRVGA
jgi:NAD-reducing hydrogenase small subunit